MPKGDSIDKIKLPSPKYDLLSTKNKTSKGNRILSPKFSPRPKKSHDFDERF